MTQLVNNEINGTGLNLPTVLDAKIDAAVFTLDDCKPKKNANIYHNS